MKSLWQRRGESHADDTNQPIKQRSDAQEEARSLPSLLIYPFENKSVIDVQFPDESDSSLVIFLAVAVAAARVKLIHHINSSHKCIFKISTKVLSSVNLLICNGYKDKGSRAARVTAC